jgi:YesN/AraC family two-component response regulator
MEATINTKAPISILLADDEEATLGILGNVLSKIFPDYPLYIANNGRAALELFMLKKPEIVITDINMPEMSGVQMAITIRSIKPGTKVIFLTGNSDMDHFGNHAQKGFEIKPYIMKPVRFELLFAAIKQSITEIEQQISGPD